MSRGLFVTVAAVSLVAVVFATAAAAGPPTSGTTANCNLSTFLDGQTTVSGFKGNPSKVQLTWSDGSSSTSADIGGKYGHLFSVSTPLTVPFLGTVAVSIWYRNSTPAWSGSVACNGGTE